MSDFTVPRKSTVKLGRVEGDLKVGHNATIEASDQNLVIVSGGVYFEGAATVNCDLECDSLKIGHGGILKINGNLIVRNLLDVEHSVEATGVISAGDIDVGGKIFANSINCKKMRVGGMVEVVESLGAETLDVGGKVEVLGTVKLGDLVVGGAAEIGGGSISGNIRIGGKFEAHSPLEFGDLQVYGHTELPAGCKGRKVSTYGRFS
ncbi:MAG: hypothetical protein ACHQ03_12125, partial [Candidatus Bathyarchaeia archaeon]